MPVEIVNGCNVGNKTVVVPTGIARGCVVQSDIALCQLILYIVVLLRVRRHNETAQ